MERKILWIFSRKPTVKQRQLGWTIVLFAEDSKGEEQAIGKDFKQLSKSLDEMFKYYWRGYISYA